MSEVNLRKVSGHVETIGMWGELEYGQTLSCCHCQSTKILAKGSGRAWFYCSKCSAYHCDRKECFECVPAERQWENLEAGRAALTPMPHSIIVPAAIEEIVGG